MPKHDFIPTTDGDLMTWHTNFKTQLAVVGAGVGMGGGEITSVNNDNTALKTALDNAAAKKAAAQGAVAAKNAARAATVDRVRALAARIKSHPAYTAAVGEQLGIVGPDHAAAMAVERPALRVVGAQNGAVKIDFLKGDSTGVEIRSKRGAETAFSFLARDTFSPYVDNRQNLGPGPETRYYQAQYLDGDDLAGDTSDVLMVTVPEK